MDRTIPQFLDELGSSLLDALTYKLVSPDRINLLLEEIEELRTSDMHLQECESYFRAAGRNDVVFFISNIIYNLKNPGEMVLTAEVMQWLTSVWKNFLSRNRRYQELFPLFNEYRLLMNNYFPGEGTIVTRLNNVQEVIKDFGIHDEEESPEALQKLEKFYSICAEITGWMKPTYFFILDYYYERRLATGIDSDDAAILESHGLTGFGYKGYTYLELMILTGEALALLEGIYLILKKKRSAKRIVVIDGKQKFLTNSEIYDLYLDRFNDLKKEMVALKQ